MGEPIGPHLFPYRKFILGQLRGIWCALRHLGRRIGRFILTQCREGRPFKLPVQPGPVPNRTVGSKSADTSPDRKRVYICNECIAVCSSISKTVATTNNPDETNPNRPDESLTSHSAKNSLRLKSKFCQRSYPGLHGCNMKPL